MIEFRLTVKALSWSELELDEIVERSINDASERTYSARNDFASFVVLCDGSIAEKTRTGRVPNVSAEKTQDQTLNHRARIHMSD